MRVLHLTSCLRIAAHYEEQVLKRVNLMLDQMVLDGLPVIDVSIDCEIVCEDDQAESSD